MNLQNRVAKSEQAAGCEAGPCGLCVSRATRAGEPPREFGPEWEVSPVMETTWTCPSCGRPFGVTVEVVARKGEA